jgi:calcium-dependent protein kinase
MVYVRHRLLQCSHLVENFVQEHFEGSAYTDDYEDFHRRDKDNKVELHCLGQGGFGSVYLIRHKTSKIYFARKAIPMSAISSHSVRLQQLHTEIAVMKEADHPNIVKLREVFFGRHEVNLVMELCGVSKLKSNRQPLPRHHAPPLPSWGCLLCPY